MSEVLINGVFCLFLISLVYCGEQQKPKLLYAEKCPPNNGSIDKEYRVIATVNLYKDRVKQYLNITFNVDKPTPQFKFRIRGFRLFNLERRGSDRKMDFIVDNIHCTNPIAELMLKKLKVNYVKSNCTGLPGHYSPRINIEDFYRYYKNAGANFKWYMFEIESFSAKGMLSCLAVTFFFQGS